MPAEISKSQVDKLGERLKKEITEQDLRLLDAFRRTFQSAYERVVGEIRDKLELEPTGRNAKSVRSIVDKLNRESIRLSQMQDIAGCRVVVEDVLQQERVVQGIQAVFPSAVLVDRRRKPSSGYRAIHAIVKYGGKAVEVQLRTTLQHLWAELSERFSDFDPMIKYGGGDRSIAASLVKLSNEINETEDHEKDLLNLSLIVEKRRVRVRKGLEIATDRLEQAGSLVNETMKMHRNRKKKLLNLLVWAMGIVKKMKG